MPFADLRAAAFLLLVALLLPAAVAAQEGRDLRAFVWGNSLVTHLDEAAPSDETAMPTWLARLATAAGHGLELDGRWGFLRDFARDLPAEPQWSLDGVAPAAREGLGFRRIGYDTLILTPANFIQGEPPDHPYADDGRDSPLAASLRLVGWATGQAAGARVWVYEGWPDMGGIGFPPAPDDLAGWHARAIGPYHDWYLSYLAGLRAGTPGAEIGLIPVSSVLSRLLTETEFAALQPEDLWVDDAPHGTPALYYLAALVTYATLWGEPPPAIDLPAEFPAALRDAGPRLSAEIWRLVGGAALPVATDAAEAPADPSLGIGLNGISDWSSQSPFIDVMKTARPWIGHLPGQWGGWDMARLEAGGFIGPDGWPLAIPDGVEKLETLVLTDLPPGETSLSGRYRVTWRGAGEVSVGGRATDVERRDHEIRFSFLPGEGPVSIALTAIPPEDPVRDIAVVREDLVPLHDLGAVFDPGWVRLIRDFRLLRFMDWQLTNGSTQVRWQDRPREGDFSWAWRGVPVETMVRLANEVGADPWFDMPHMADDAYVAAFATLVHDRLDPRLKAHVEWSNEVWNFLFPQAAWARDRALERWGDDAPDDAWMQYAGLRAAEVAGIWAEAFADAPGRLVRVVATHTGWPGLEAALLDAPLAVAEGLAPPGDSFDAYAVTGYFGYELGNAGMTATLQDWASRPDGYALAAAALREGSFGELTGELWPYHAGVARDRGLRLLAYEGGTHVVGHGAVTEDAAATAFFTGFNYSDEMASLYADLLTDWRAVGGETFAAFVDVAAPSRWGSWGALRHRDDSNPRWSTLLAANAAPAGWAARAPGTFGNGGRFDGTDGADTLDGTPEEDVIFAGAGDDAIRATPGDLIDGGPGTDRATLPGAAADWSVDGDGELTILSGPGGRVGLLSVEVIDYLAEGDPNPPSDDP